MYELLQSIDPRIVRRLVSEARPITHFVLLETVSELSIPRPLRPKFNEIIPPHGRASWNVACLSFALISVSLDPPLRSCSDAIGTIG